MKLSGGVSWIRVFLLVFTIVVLLPVALFFGGLIGFFLWIVWTVLILAAKPK